MDTIEKIEYIHEAWPLAINSVPVGNERFVMEASRRAAIRFDKGNTFTKCNNPLI